MFAESTFLRSLLIFGLLVPLAVVMGYLLATPTQFTSIALVGFFFLALSIPAWIKWHHTWLVFTWNATLIVFFMPGQPYLGFMIAAGSFFISVLNRTLGKRDTFLHVPSVAWALICLTLVIVVTAMFTGGIGSRALGSETYGGRRYFGVFGAILGYFALVAQRISLERARRAAHGYFLSGVTALGSDLTYLAGPPFYFLFAIFPPVLAGLLATTQTTMTRSAGIAWSALAAFCYLIVRFGLRGLFDLTRPGRLVTLAVVVVASLFGGFRSAVITIGLIFLVQFFCEGLHRTRLLPGLLLGGLLLAAVGLAFLDKMPLAVQRSLSFLPLEVDHRARQDAEATLDWRLQMWKITLPEVPKYLLLGKGFSYSGADHYLTAEAVKHGLMQAYEDTLISGNYHNGVLTLIIPFGIFGVGAFGWFCIASLLVLRRNYLFGHPELRLVNTFLLSHFIARLIFYVFFYGQFDLDLMVFTGNVALSISLNGGVARLADRDALQQGGLAAAPAS